MGVRGDINAQCFNGTCGEEMRIIHDGILPYSITMSGDNKKSNLYFETATIEITDDEWEQIYYGFDEWETNNLYEDFEPTFAQYLRELMKLARLK